MAAAEIAEAEDLSPIGIKADGLTDDTAAIQKALDAVANTGGSVVLPAARYRVAGNLKIPTGGGLFASEFRGRNRNSGMPNKSGP